MSITLIQTQFLRRFIDMESRPVPAHGPLSMVSVRSDWLKVTDSNKMLVRITDAGIKAFWAGVKKHGAQAVMNNPIPSGNPTNNPPTGGTPAAISA